MAVERPDAHNNSYNITPGWRERKIFFAERFKITAQEIRDDYPHRKCDNIPNTATETDSAQTPYLYPNARIEMEEAGPILDGSEIASRIRAMFECYLGSAKIAATPAAIDHGCFDSEVSSCPKVLED